MALAGPAFDRAGTGGLMLRCPGMKMLVPAALMLAAPALADPPGTLTVVNASATSVNQLFVRQAGRPERSGVAGAIGDLVAPRGDRDDRLGSTSLRGGGSIAVPLTGIRGCKVDIRAVMEDGRIVAASAFDACASSRWVIGR